MITSVVQRWRFRRDSYRPAGEVIATHRFEVAKLARDTEAKSFVVAHHYSSSFPAARFRFGLFEQQELVGVAVFSAPFPAALESAALPGEAPVELSRFVLLDRVPANAETWMLARCWELLRQDADAVLSFSDPMPRRNADGAVVFGGHVGTIYRALNGVYLAHEADHGALLGGHVALEVADMLRLGGAPADSVDADLPARIAALPRVARVALELWAADLWRASDDAELWEREIGEMAT